MNLFISYFKKAPALYLVILIAILFEVGLHLIPNLHYIDGGGSFFTTYKKRVAENKNVSYDFVMYGDSRSLSIFGKKRQAGVNDYSMYNFSLPAAGPRYFKFYLKKYLKNHPKPKAVIWAADPEQLQVSKSFSFHSDRVLWGQYKHRLLNLFSVSENFEQYQGKELFFIMKESVPNLLLSVKHREGIEKFLSGVKLHQIRNLKLPNVERNILIESMVNKTNGQINLGTFFLAPEGASSADSMKPYLAAMQKTEYVIEPLRDFLEFCKEEGLPVVVLDVPHAVGLNSTPFYQSVSKAIAEEVRKSENAIYLKFPENDYPYELFSESIHYNTKGETRVNKDFDLFIYPKIIEFANAHEKK